MPVELDIHSLLKTYNLVTAVLVLKYIRTSMARTDVFTTAVLESLGKNSIAQIWDNLV